MNSRGQAPSQHFFTTGRALASGKAWNGLEHPGIPRNRRESQRNRGLDRLIRIEWGIMALNLRYSEIFVCFCNESSKKGWFSGDFCVISSWNRCAGHVPNSDTSQPSGEKVQKPWDQTVDDTQTLWPYDLWYHDLIKFGWTSYFNLYQWWIWHVTCIVIVCVDWDFHQILHLSTH